MHAIAILGGGVNGLATGILLCERFPRAKISIIAELTGDETTSRGAGGLWKPFSLGLHLQQAFRDLTKSSNISMRLIFPSEFI